MPMFDEEDPYLAAIDKAKELGISLVDFIFSPAEAADPKIVERLLFPGGTSRALTPAEIERDRANISRMLDTSGPPKPPQLPRPLTHAQMSGKDLPGYRGGWVPRPPTQEEIAAERASWPPLPNEARQQAAATKSIDDALAAIEARKTSNAKGAAIATGALAGISPLAGSAESLFRYGYANPEAPWDFASAGLSSPAGLVDLLEGVAQYGSFDPLTQIVAQPDLSRDPRRALQIPNRATQLQTAMGGNPDSPASLAGGILGDPTNWLSGAGIVGALGKGKDLLGLGDKVSGAPKLLDASKVFSTTDPSAIGSVANQTDALTKPRWRMSKKATGEVQYMSPDEYLEKAADLLSSKEKSPVTVESLVSSRPRKDWVGIADAMGEGKVFASPWLDYRSGMEGQEGIHRALAAKHLGMDKIPVTVIKPFEAKGFLDEDPNKLAGIGMPSSSPLIDDGKPFEIGASLPEQNLLYDQEPVHFGTGGELPELKNPDRSPRNQQTGQWWGGPKHIDTPQKMKKFRERLKQKAFEGMDYRNWYRDTSNDIHSAANEMPNNADRYAATLAVSSADNKVVSNASMGIKGYNQSLLGAPLDYGRYPEQARSLTESLFAGTAENPNPLGNKVGTFGDSLRTMFKTGDDVPRSTNDMWMFDAFEYGDFDPKTKTHARPKGAPNAAQHRFMSQVQQEMADTANKEKWGGFDDWTPDRIQAAIWVPQKARGENVPLDMAGRHFGDFNRDNTMQITVESMPGPKDHLPALREDPALARIYHENTNRIYATDDGRSKIAQSIGALTRPGYQGVGSYQGEHNPVSVYQLLAGKHGVPNGKLDPKGNPKMDYFLDPSSETIARYIAATEGLLRGQQSVGYSYGAGRGSGTIFDMSLGGVATGPQMSALETALGPNADKFALTPHEGGMRILNYNEGDPKDLQKAARQAGLPNMRRQTGTSDVVGNFDDYKPSSYLGDIEANEFLAQRFDSFAPTLAKQAYDHDAKLGMQTNKHIQLARKIIATRGLAGLREAIQQGILPAALGAAILSGLQQRDNAGESLSPTA